MMHSVHVNLPVHGGTTFNRLATDHVAAPCRLTSLPPGVLWLIARRMGRRSRTVSRALLAAYGPLDCGLVFSGSATFNELQRMLGGSSSGWHLRQVKSLQLLPPVRKEEAKGAADLLASIAAKLPHLESLALGMGPPDLSLLAPLRSTLTALDMQLPSHAFTIGDAGLSLLTNLRSLTFTGAPGGGDRVAWQDLPRSLPQLVLLNTASSAWTPQWLAGLGSRMPHLTSLALGFLEHHAGHAWDAGATATLRQALTGLRSLSLHAMSLNDSSAVDAMIEALSHCTWLEALHLLLVVGPTGPAPNLLQLASVRLASLDMRIVRTHMGPLEAGLHALTHLTKLELCYYCGQAVSAPQLPSSLVTLQLSGNWSPSSLLPPLHALPSLRVLILHHSSNDRGASWTAPGAEQLSKLTQLHSLAIMPRCPRLLLPHLSALTTLRELCLAADNTEHGVTDQDLVHLFPLRELTRLALSRMQRVSASGVLALLEALPNLQQFKLAGMLQPAAHGGALVEGLLPRVLPRLTSLQLVGVQLPGLVRDSLLSAAEVHGCRCVL
jgi:hypothetical protein